MDNDDYVTLFDIGKKIGQSMFAIASASAQVQNLKDRFEHIDCEEIIENLDIAYCKLQEI